MPLWIAVIILGIVEGITEFLPVSSTGHLLLVEKFLHSKQSDLFNVVIQCGAVLAVLPLFPERLHQFFFRWREKETQLYLAKILVAFGITGAIGFVLEKKGFKLPEELKPVAVALLVGGIGFVLVETWLRGKALKNEVTWAVVLAVGIGQIIAAVFPGTSRSGSTILLALILGLNRVAATEFTFLVGIPTMLAAGGLKIFKALHHHSQGTARIGDTALTVSGTAASAPAASENWAMVALGFVVAAIVSFIAVKWLLRYIQTHTFILFGWYRIGLALLILALLATSALK